MRDDLRVSANGTLSTLYTFKGTTDGGIPTAASCGFSGNLYGTAQNYGNTSCNKKGGNPDCGTVFRLNRKRKFKVLHVFAGSPDGAAPNETMIIDKQGNLYGTTSFGGDDAATAGTRAAPSSKSIRTVRSRYCTRLPAGKRTVRFPTAASCAMRRAIFTAQP